MRTLIIKWLHEALKLQTGEEIYIPADNKDTQKDLYKMFRRELDTLREIDPEGAAKIRVGTAFKDMKMWVMLRKVSVTPLVAFKKSASGVERVSITNDRKERSL